MKIRMKIGIFLEYKGYTGSIEYDFEDKIYYGQILNINDSISYHADNVIDLYDHYRETVDFYIEFKNTNNIKGKING